MESEEKQEVDLGLVTRKTLLKYEEERRGVESEIASLVMDLNTPPAAGAKPPGVRGNLNTEDGFPRADIDHYAVRLQRKRLNCLQTDLKILMQKIEQGLTVLMANKAVKSRGSTDGSGKQQTAEPSWRSYLKKYSAPLEDRELQKTLSKSSTSETGELVSKGDSNLQQDGSAPATLENTVEIVPFAVVDDVAPGGPASAAGFRIGDKIVRFGSINHENHDGLRNVAKEVSRCENQQVTIIVERANASCTLQLVPQRWDGRGLLGCHILPL